jgi:broad specificity phosphatase PhoE
MAAMRIFALLLLVLPHWALADEALWQRLAAGGQVILVRHTITTPGTGDPPGMRLEDCSTQRNLSDEGRAHARRIRAELGKRNIPVARVLSSPWCRCLETARLAFGEPEVSQALGNLFGRRENEEKQVRELRSLAVAWRGPGNLVMVTHGSTIHALTGVSPGTGEMVVLAPQQRGGSGPAARLAIR